MHNALATHDRISRAQYDRLVAQGELNDRRVELVRGEIVAMSPQGPRHATAVRNLIKLLARAMGDDVELQIQAPLALSADSEPEPDVSIIELGDYRSEHPATALLVIEVADSSLARDRGDKASLYAECGVPEYWIVNLIEETVEVFLHPEAGAYQTVTTRPPGDPLRPTRLPAIEIAVADLF